jgi:3-oxoacyl-[acyl-carrier protein] reductase
MNKLKGKNILITAGAQGIGASITQHFIECGANVAVHYFSSETVANQLVKDANNKGQKALNQRSRCQCLGRKDG